MIDTRQTRALTSLPASQGIVAALATVMRTWAIRRHERRSLARLDTHLLRDVGLDATTAGSESAKPFWLE